MNPLIKLCQKYSYTKEPFRLAVLIQHENCHCPGGEPPVRLLYARVVTLVGALEERRIRNTQIPELNDLCFQASVSPKWVNAYCPEGARYSSARNLDIVSLKRKLRALEVVVRRFDKLAAKDKSVFQTTFGEDVARFAQAVGAETIVLENSGVSNHWDYDTAQAKGAYRFRSPAAAYSELNEWINQFVDATRERHHITPQ